MRYMYKHVNLISSKMHIFSAFSASFNGWLIENTAGIISAHGINDHDYKLNENASKSLTV